ncbi:hypothetical protein FA09DRAFT_168239 [Tilletiopsis washingtonensis]|uniref:Uncharacterized protein n=1 Tax=Tilletiopsis washingtonensis TaxID=58919 RepID=A0A316YZA3_9BASI|nr:hypothetical protein FA09DRAFT_168239 [Tilletiopsis washingtonensis]PWN94777.1 hypothetical protein FA09DRAFT_168239 [Tilletiopsis washingtonensis]
MQRACAAAQVCLCERVRGVAADAALAVARSVAFAHVLRTLTARVRLRPHDDGRQGGFEPQICHNTAPEPPAGGAPSCCRCAKRREGCVAALSIAPSHVVPLRCPITPHADRQPLAAHRQHVRSDPANSSGCCTSISHTWGPDIGGVPDA